MSAFCPFATQLIIPPGPNDPPIRPRLVILHVDAGNADSLYTFFRDRSGGIESHFFVKKTGEIEQYRGIFDQADANLDANDFAVSIETQGFDAGEWNLEQLASIKRLLLWLHDTVGIPLVKVPTWDGAGVGYHTQFGAPSHWTPVAKSCPGPDRIKQFSAVLVPWMADQGASMPTVRNIEEVTAETNSDGDVVDYDVTNGGHWPVLGVVPSPDDAFNVVIRASAGTMGVQYRKNFRCFKRLADGTLAPNANASVRFVFLALG
jgi:hypothetical protein